MLEVPFSMRERTTGSFGSGAWCARRTLQRAGGFQEMVVSSIHTAFGHPDAERVNTQFQEVARMLTNFHPIPTMPTTATEGKILLSEIAAA